MSSTSTPSGTANPATTLKVDHEILPKVVGRGRFLGANLGVIANPVYEGSWWGEGEVKVYLDGDGDSPTLVGTGTEDYIGTGWGQGAYAHRFQGCLIADADRDQWAFYRYHVPDPVYFGTDARVTIQQIGGNQKAEVIRMMDEGVPLIPISIHEVDTLHLLLDRDPVPELTDPDLPDGWTNFYRSDDVSSTAYFYLDRPVSGLPALQPVGGTDGRADPGRRPRRLTLREPGTLLRLGGQSAACVPRDIGRSLGAASMRRSSCARTARR